MSRIELVGVTKRYGGHEVIPRLDLDLPAQQTYVLIGPSGCGKSTILRMILGLEVPDEGVVRLDGVDISQGDVAAVRRRVGYVIQDGGVFPHLTAWDNVTIVGRFLGWRRDRLHQRVLALASLTRFPTDGLERYPSELSGGQRQRVGLMRALLLDPDVLLLDEPMAALDPLVRSELQEDLREVFRSLGKTVVLVTHDLHEAAYPADEVILLRDGRIVQRGNVEDLLDRPSDPFAERFVRAQRISLPGAER